MSERIQLIDTYYDTSDLHLRRAGCTWRVRQADNRTRPRLAWPGVSSRRRGAKQRPETEVPLEHLPRNASELSEVLVEVKSQTAARCLDDARRELRSLFDGALVAPARGKVRELCRRLYPELARG